MLQTSNLAVLLIFPALFISGTQKSARVDRSRDQVLQRVLAEWICDFVRLFFARISLLAIIFNIVCKLQYPAENQITNRVRKRLCSKKEALLPFIQSAHSQQNYHELDLCHAIFIQC